MWKKVKEQINLEADFVANETYPETQLGKMGKTAMKILSLKDEEFYEGMGKYFVQLATDAVHKPDPENDQINKDYVFKLVFKNHVYFFRAESQYTFERYDNFFENLNSFEKKICNILNIFEFY